MTNTNTMTAMNTLDRLITGIARRAGTIITAANRAAIMIAMNPADFAGRAVTLLQAMDGLKAQKNLSEFFGDYLPNELTQEKGVFKLGKKRPEWVEPPILSAGLTPCTYKNQLRAAERRLEAVVKREETKAAKTAADLATIAEKQELKLTIDRLKGRIRELESEILTLRAPPPPVEKKPRRKTA